jgi:hypothetical protein
LEISIDGKDTVSSENVDFTAAVFEAKAHLRTNGPCHTRFASVESPP